MLPMYTYFYIYAVMAVCENFASLAKTVNNI